MAAPDVRHSLAVIPVLHHECRDNLSFLRDLWDEEDSLWRCDQCRAEWTGTELARIEEERYAHV